MESLAADGGGLILWTVITFACLLVLLSRFAFRPLARVLKEREDTIRRALDEARAAREDAERILAENETRLGQAREETRKIINEGHRIVADMKREAREQAKREADTIVGQARTEIDREVKRSLNDLKSTVANLSVRISRQVMKEQLDEKRHHRMADDFIDRLKKTYAGRSSTR